MSAWLVVVLAVVAALLIGLGRLVLTLKRLSERHEFGMEYLKRFSLFAKSAADSSFDSEAYIWLTERVTKMQADMGYHGVLEFYKPPFASYALRNYQILPQTLTNMRGGHAFPEEAGFCQDAILRYLGQLHDVHDSVRGQMKNPFVWLRESVSLIVTLPLRLAQWFGLYEYSTFARLSGSWLVKALTFISTLAGFAVAVMTLVMGWSRFGTVVRSWFHR
jgi:hypothetical protein